MVVDPLGLPGRIGVVVKPVRVFDDLIEFLYRILIQQLIGSTEVLSAEIPKRAEQRSGGKLPWAHDAKKGFEVRTNRPSDLSHVSCAGIEKGAQLGIAAIMLGNRVMGDVPHTESGACPVAHYLDSRSHGRIGALPEPAHERLVVGEDNDLGGPLRETTNLLHRRQGSMLV